MTLNTFLACCVLGCDLLVFAFFQWAFREKYRGHVRKGPRKRPPQAPRRDACLPQDLS
jgi:hypothetical protein